MPNLKVVIAGNGPLANIFAKAFIDTKSIDVTIVGRKGKDEAAPGTTTKLVPEWDVDGLAEAFAGADYIVSTLGFFSLGDPQFTVIKAAKKAGVKGISLSEYGGGVDGFPTSPAVAWKQPARTLATEIGLPWIALVNGGFLEYSLSVFLSDDEKKVATVFGSPDVKLSLTAREDVGVYLAQALLRFDEFKNGEVQVSGVTTTVREIIAEVGKVKGIHYTIDTEPIEETKAKSAANPGDHARMFGIIFAEGFVLNNNDISSKFPSVHAKGLEYWIPKLLGAKA
ncbi:hypothetical protein HDU93_003839 [Gonapodya sp. JEL0774]|nr:hypothetical protein HDU93_003839 [Gonapodya sp. JEL0774]